MRSAAAAPKRGTKAATRGGGAAKTTTSAMDFAALMSQAQERSKDAAAANKPDPLTLRARLALKAKSVCEWLDRDRRQTDAEIYQKNSNALAAGGEMHIARQPLLSTLTVKGMENADEHSVAMRRGFLAPRTTGNMSDAARKLIENRPPNGIVLGFRRRLNASLIPLCFTKPPSPDTPIAAPPPPVVEKPSEDKTPGLEPLILWQPSEEQLKEDPNRKQIEVETCLLKFLRPHQREGVRFMAECVLGMRDFKGNGCILADDMGLGDYTNISNGQVCTSRISCSLRFVSVCFAQARRCRASRCCTRVCVRASH
jgi:hypothetical protein